MAQFQYQHKLEQEASFFTSLREHSLLIKNLCLNLLAFGKKIDIDIPCCPEFLPQMIGTDPAFGVVPPGLGSAVLCKNYLNQLSLVSFKKHQFVVF